ncbi:MAG: response regulator [Patescibacteria group bacterium]
MIRILVVDDDDAIRALFSQKLKNTGYDVSLASSGEEGLSQASQVHPDLILLDILLPGGMDGMELLKRLRQTEWGKATPVIVLSNLDATGQILHDILEAKPAYYIVKVRTTPDEVIQKVTEVVSKTA